jgi:hypothetical protein
MISSAIRRRADRRASHPIAFKKGAVALNEVALLPPAPSSGELRWFLPPRILRRVARTMA